MFLSRGASLRLGLASDNVLVASSGDGCTGPFRYGADGWEHLLIC